MSKHKGHKKEKERKSFTARNHISNRINHCGDYRIARLARS